MSWCKPWLLCAQCYVQQLRQIRQDAQQTGQDPPTEQQADPSKSGEADWSLLSPRGDLAHLQPELALMLKRTVSGQTPAMASTQVHIDQLSAATLFQVLA